MIWIEFTDQSKLVVEDLSHGPRLTFVPGPAKKK